MDQDTEGSLGQLLREGDFSCDVTISQCRSATIQCRDARGAWPVCRGTEEVVGALNRFINRRLLLAARDSHASCSGCRSKPGAARGRQSVLIIAGERNEPAEGLEGLSQS